MTIENTLAERGARYGKFAEHAEIAQNIQAALVGRPGWERLAPDQKQALLTITDKMARILNGDPNYSDNWHDIMGYAKLVDDRLVGEQPKQEAAPDYRTAGDNNALKEQLTYTNGRLEQLQEQHVKDAQEIQELRAQRDEAQLQRDEMQQQRNDVQRSLTAMASARDTLSREVTELQQELAESKSNNGKAVDHILRANTNRNLMTKERDSAIARYEELSAIVNTPETSNFLVGMQREIPHQIIKWRSESDLGKTAFDWVFLIGSLATRAAMYLKQGNMDKARHHCITTAAACANWHAALIGQDTGMRPGHEHREAGINPTTQGYSPQQVVVDEGSFMVGHRTSSGLELHAKAAGTMTGIAEAIDSINRPRQA